MSLRLSTVVHTCVPILALSGVVLLPISGCTEETTTAAAISEPVALPDSVANAWEGKVVVVDFWATWCGPCRSSSPYVQQLHEQFASDESVLVVAVHADDSVEDPAAYLAEHEYTYPLIAQGQSLANVFGVTALPTFVVLDAEGREVMRHVGMMNEKVRKTFEKKVKALRD